MDSKFEQYEIINYLRSKDPSLYSKVVNIYDICKSLLAEIPATFSNYTLHDIGHSVRVIGYMNDLVKCCLNQFSSLHLAMIVYVGLLHDVGMVVSEDERDSLYRNFELTDSKFKTLSTEDRNQYLKNYIRNIHAKRVSEKITIPINGDTNIRSFLYVGEADSYDISEQIVLICQSHGESCAWIEDNLDTELYYADYEIHPQQIALLLRIGDALDIDSRRAPYFLYKLLNPKEESGKEWRKHIPITNYNKIIYNNGLCKIRFTGESSNPDIYRKVLNYIDEFHRDIKKSISISRNWNSPYCLNIDENIEKSIRTKGFIATTLQFQLEYQKITKLLMGENIYGTKQDGLRELIQNSIDAVMLMRDIESKNSYSMYYPKVGVEIDEKKHQIIIFDNGIGMSDRILSEYFFAIGNSYYISDEFSNENYTYKPIGHFGIGFLACFMLSSKISLETKHHSMRSSVIRMDFDSDSPYITRLDNNEPFPMDHGTRVILDYNQVIPKVFPSIESIYSYLDDLLAPNNFKVSFSCDQMGEKEVGKMAFSETYTVDGEIINFSCKFDENSSVRFDLFEYFEKNENVYIVDFLYDELSEDYITLQHLDLVIRNWMNGLKMGNMLWSEYLDTFPPCIRTWLYYSWLVNKVPNSEETEICKDGRLVFQYYISSFTRNNTLSWYEIPVILNNKEFSDFIRTVETLGLEEAKERYSASVENIYILCDKPLSNELVLRIIKSHIEHHAEARHSTNLNDNSVYPISPIFKKIHLNGFPTDEDSEMKYSFAIRANYQIPLSNIYLKSIRIREEFLVLPYAISGIGIESLSLNIQSGDYSTDISRNNLDEQSREKLSKRIGQLIYNYFMSNRMLSKQEIDLINDFLHTYYK